MLDPKALGAKTSLDFGVFLLAGGIGGILDAILNIADFADPIVFGGMCGAGALGLKNVLSALYGPASEPPPDKE